MSADFSNKGTKKTHHPKKYFYNYAYENGADDFSDEYSDLAAEFEQPKNRRQAKKDTIVRKRRQSADLFY